MFTFLITHRIICTRVQSSHITYSSPILTFTDAKVHESIFLVKKYTIVNPICPIAIQGDDDFSTASRKITVTFVAFREIFASWFDLSDEHQKENFAFPNF